MLSTLLDRYCRLLGFAMVACLAVMVVLVFGNVVMRYGFNSGFTLSAVASTQASRCQRSCRAGCSCG
jgi:TRAP-type C4-dicarboxylate transport system permease small subunit